MNNGQWWSEQEGDDVVVRPLFDAARRYLWNGWYPIPVARETKMPTLGNWPEACRNINYEIVEALWDRDDAPSIGLVTGIVFDVLDIDGQEGLASLTDHLAGRSFRPSGPIAITGRGGRHVLFQPTGHGNRGNLLPNVDFRGFHGHVVAPPSVHENGNTYRWAEGHAWDEVELPPAPAWLLDLLVTTKPPETTEHKGDGIDYGLVSDALTAADILYRRDGSRYVFECRTGRHSDSEWSAKTGLGNIPDRKWKCFGCDAWGDAENLRSDTHVLRGVRYENVTLQPASA